jgi:hypothetical protein
MSSYSHSQFEPALKFLEEKKCEGYDITYAENDCITIFMNESTCPNLIIRWYNFKDGVVIPTRYTIEVIYAYTSFLSRKETELDGLNNEIQNVLDKFDCYKPQHILK